MGSRLAESREGAATGDIRRWVFRARPDPKAIALTLPMLDGACVEDSFATSVCDGVLDVADVEESQDNRTRAPLIGKSAKLPWR